MTRGDGIPDGYDLDDVREEQRRYDDRSHALRFGPSAYEDAGSKLTPREGAARREVAEKHETERRAREAAHRDATLWSRPVDAYDEWVARWRAKNKSFGQCKRACEEMRGAFPDLRQARGHVLAGPWGERAHWWLIAPDGRIVDPTADQYPTVAFYEEWKPGAPVMIGRCMDCGEEIWRPVQTLDEAPARETFCGSACAKATTEYLESRRIGPSEMPMPSFSEEDERQLEDLVTSGVVRVVDVSEAAFARAKERSKMEIERTADEEKAREGVKAALAGFGERTFGHQVPRPDIAVNDDPRLVQIRRALASLPSGEIDDRRVGGTDLAAILGESDYGGPIDVYARLVEGVRKETTPEMRRGKVFERGIGSLWLSELHPEANLAWLADLGTKFDRAGERLPLKSLTHPAREWQRFSPDCFTLMPGPCPAPGGNRYGADIEVADIKRAHFARGRHGPPGTDQIAAYELIQLQTYAEALTSLGLPIARCRLIVHDLYSDEIMEWVMPRDADFGAMLVEAGEKFWRDHVVPKVPPPLDASAGYTAFLERKYPHVKADLRDADAIEEELGAELREIQAKAKDLDAAEKEIKNLLRERIGEGKGIKGSWGSVTWSAVKDSFGTDWERVANVLAGKAGIGLPELRAVAESNTKRTRTGGRTLSPHWKKGKTA